MQTYETNSEEYSPLFKSMNIRYHFQRKVFSLLTIQLLYTVFMTCIPLIFPQYLIFSLENLWLSTCALLLTVVLPLSMAFVPSLGRKVPNNYVILFAFTTAYGHILSHIHLVYPARIIILAGLMTVGACAALVVYCLKQEGFNTNKGIVGLTIFQLVLIFLGWSDGILYACLGSVLFATYLVYDLRLILKGNRRQIQIDDYIVATMMLYTDIVGLFLQILKILDRLTKKKKDQ